MPTPTVSPLSGEIDGKVCWASVSPAVENRRVLVTVLPESSWAELTTVYVVPGSSSMPAVQRCLSADSVPLTEPDFELTTTEDNRAFLLVTCSRWSTGTCVAPRATLAATTTAGVGGADGELCEEPPPDPGFVPPALGLPPPVPQPAATRDRPSRVAASSGRRARRTDIRLPGR